MFSTQLLQRRPFVSERPEGLIYFFAQNSPLFLPPKSQHGALWEEDEEDMGPGRVCVCVRFLWEGRSARCFLFFCGPVVEKALPVEEAEGRRRSARATLHTVAASDLSNPRSWSSGELHIGW